MMIIILLIRLVLIQVIICLISWFVICFQDCFIVFLIFVFLIFITVSLCLQGSRKAGILFSFLIKLVVIAVIVSLITWFVICFQDCVIVFLIFGHFQMDSLKTFILN